MTPFSFVPSHMTSGMSAWLLISETPCVSLLFSHRLNVPPFIFTWSFASFESASDSSTIFPFLWSRQSSSFHFAICDPYFSVCMCLLVQFGGHGKYECEKILLWCTFSYSLCSFGSQYHILGKSYFGNNTFTEFWHRILTHLCVKYNNNHLTGDLFFLSVLNWSTAGSFFLFPLLFSQASNRLKQNKHTENPFPHKRAFKVLEESKK